MKRVLLGAVLAGCALVRLDGAGLPFSLSFTASTDLVNIGTSSLLTDMAVGTVYAWIKPATVNTTGKRIYQKGVMAVDSTFLSFTIRDTTDGDLAFIMKRTTDLVARTATGTVKAGVWQFAAATWNTGGANSDQHVYLGTLSSPITELALTTQTVGAGAHPTDATAPGIIGNKSNGSNPLNGPIALLGLYSQQLSLGDLRRQQMVGARPVSMVGCIGFYVLAANGAGPVMNRCNPSVANGAITGARPTNANLPRVMFMRPGL